jgi:ubiquinone/menaquinone biosynthesis C-methylase UbiE
MGVDQDTIARFKRAVEAEWRDPRVTSAYRKWKTHETAWGSALRDLLIGRAELARGLDVLDIGSAHGEPGIAVAGVVKPGRVTLVDIAPDLLEIATARARQEGLGNVDTRVADAHTLPFEDDSFDRVTSRLAAMYFAEPDRAFREALRVLRPSGMAAWLAWGPFDQPMFSDIIGTIFKYVAPPDDEPGAPSPFRYSETGSLSSALVHAGFTDVREESVTVPTPFPGDPAQWWEWLVDTAAPVQTWMAGMSDPDRERAMSEIQRTLRSYSDGRTVNIPVQVVVATGRKSEASGRDAKVTRTNGRSAA